MQTNKLNLSILLWDFNLLSFHKNIQRKRNREMDTCIPMYTKSHEVWHVCILQPCTTKFSPGTKYKFTKACERISQLLRLPCEYLCVFIVVLCVQRKNLVYMHRCLLACILWKNSHKAEHLDNLKACMQWYSKI